MKITIFGFPRSGTKLLANIYKQQGYHSFGEFFNPSTTDIVNDSLPFAIRSKNWQDNNPTLTEERLNLFKQFIDVDPSTVTLMPIALYYMPTLLNSLGNRYVLCTRRSNKFEQLLSCLLYTSDAADE